MSFRVVVSAMLDETDDPDDPQAIERLTRKFADYGPDRLEYRLREADHGLGASWTTVVIEVFSIGSAVFFGIPALRKKFKDSIAGWKEIKKGLDKFLDWLRGHEHVVSYSKELAFLKAISGLEEVTEISEVELFGFLEIPGKSGGPDPDFESAELVYYLFLFRDNDELLYMVMYDSGLNLVLSRVLQLDPRYFLPPPNFPSI